MCARGGRRDVSVGPPVRRRRRRPHLAARRQTAGLGGVVAAEQLPGDSDTPYSESEDGAEAAAAAAEEAAAEEEEEEEARWLLLEGDVVWQLQVGGGVKRLLSGAPVIRCKEQIIRPKTKCHFIKSLQVCVPELFMSAPFLCFCLKNVYMFGSQGCFCKPFIKKSFCL